MRFSERLIKKIKGVMTVGDTVLLFRTAESEYEEVKILRIRNKEGEIVESVSMEQEGQNPLEKGFEILLETSTSKLYWNFILHGGRHLIMPKGWEQ